MVAVNKHRYRMSGLPAMEMEKWGRSAARERYGTPRFEDGNAPPPKDQSYVQGAGDPAGAGVPARGFKNDSAGWARGSARGKPMMHSEDGTNKPGGGFDRQNSWRQGKNPKLRESS